MINWWNKIGDGLATRVNYVTEVININKILQLFVLFCVEQIKSMRDIDGPRLVTDVSVGTCSNRLMVVVDLLICLSPKTAIGASKIRGRKFPHAAIEYMLPGKLEQIKRGYATIRTI